MWLFLCYRLYAQLEAIKPYADANDVLILSAGSSSTSLSTPGDNILRFNADDSSQATVISQLLRQANISVIIPLVREDYWGNFANLTILDKPMNKITQDEVVRYDPKSQKYDEVIDRLDQMAGLVLANKDKDSVGVLAFTFDDIVQIMEEVSKEKYKNNLTSGAFWKKIGRLDKFSDLARPAITWEDYNTTYMPAS